MSKYLGFQLFKEQVKYYLSLRQLAKERVRENDPLASKQDLKDPGIIRKWINKVIKSVARNAPHLLFQNPLSDLAFKVGLLVIQKKIITIKQDVVSKLSLFENNVPPQFQLPYFSDEDVLVSIIIPVHNNYAFTHRCIFAIQQFCEGIQYEILVGDDASTDETQFIQKNIQNVRVFVNNPGLGFLLNCNQTASHARGKFIVFLNNDTVVQQGWLQSLLTLIQSDATIGMVGSKLVYPDGLLQEAGGIIWSDASGWNYGRLGMPIQSEYNYVKEVDYISGASILIPTKLWKKIGGFDERFVPAYYEDSDLAMEVRRNGYKVMYQPESVVIHFEGVSHGTDVQSGIKEFQVKNKSKFLAKWSQELTDKHSPNEQELFLARDRSQNKKTILVIDHYVPEFDRDAGSKSIYQCLATFVRMGMNVKFLGDNFVKKEPYTKLLQQMGVEVLYGYEYSSGWRSWIENNGRFFDYVFLNRPHITEKYIDHIRRFTSAKIIYYGHDLHFLREQRQYEIEQNKALLKSASEWKEKEKNIFDKADFVLYPSQIEVDLVKQINSNIQVYQMPPFCYENQTGNDYQDYTNTTENLLFVGGFKHPPNEDGMLWFCREIFPLIQKKQKDIRLIIAGSNPTQAILNLQSDDIKVTGFVSDLELKKLYENCRIVIAPLRYGAGIKGKIVEAIYYRKPVITTKIGAEGLAIESGEILTAETPQEFAESVVELYNDFKRCKQVFETSPLFIQKYFSQQNMTSFMQQNIIK